MRTDRSIAPERPNYSFRSKILAYRSILIFVISYCMHSAILEVSAESITPVASPTSSSSTNQVTCDRDLDGVRSNDQVCGGRDCNDTDPKIHPGQTESNAEFCSDGKDNDCNGTTDCSDRGCLGRSTFLPGIFTLKPTGTCCISGGAGEIVNTASDQNNCGGCGIKCSAGQVCAGGSCFERCSSPRTICFKDMTSDSSLSSSTNNANLDAIKNLFTTDPQCPPAKQGSRSVKLDVFSEEVRGPNGERTGIYVKGMCLTGLF